MIPWLGTDTFIEIIYLIATALFILALVWMRTPATARRGVRAGEIGMFLAIGGTLLNHNIIEYKWIAIALVLGSIIGVPLGMVHMTAVPAANRAQPRLRRVLRHARRHRGILSARAQRAALHDVRAFDGSNSRRAHLHRQPDGRRKTAGNPAAAPHHI